jgi:trigger factor
MSIDGSHLQISVQEQEQWRRRMSVTVPASLVQEEERRAAAQLASRARLKGFRKGHVPARVIESRFGGTLRQEALDKLIGDAYREALATEELRPISEGELQDVSYEPEEDLVFSIAFDVQPEIEVSRLGGFAVERPSLEIDDEHVDQVLARIQEQNGAWKPVETGSPEDRDLVSVRIRKLDGEASGEGKEYEFILGQNDAIPDIEAAIKTLEMGASGEFDIGFPDDFPDESRRGESERVEVTVLGRKSLELPALDDDLARQAGDFETLADLRRKVSEDLLEDARRQAESVVRGRLLDLLVEANPFEVPASMVNRYAEGILGEQTGLDPEKLDEIRESIRPEAERAVKRILLIDRVAETQGLTATDDDVDARIEEIAAASDSTAAKVYASLQKAGRIEALERELTEKKVFDFLEEQSEITDGPAA